MPSGVYEHPRRHHMKGTPTWWSWRAMKKRVLEVNHPWYFRYGGRGITICERWLHSFQNFLADLGPRPEGHTLERRDNDGNYEPGNCYWATPKQQRANRSI